MSLFELFCRILTKEKNRATCGEWNSGFTNCEEQSRSILERLQNPLPLSELEEMLETALQLQDQNLQTSRLEEIVEELKLAPSSDEKEYLQNQTLFELHGRIVEAHIREGIKTLQSGCAPSWVSLTSRIVDYRQQQGQNLDQVLEDLSNTASRLDHNIAKAARESQRRAQKLKWMYKHDCWTARAVSRKYDAQFSHTKIPEKEREQRRQEKLPLLIYHIMDELVPILGAGVIFIYAAFQGMTTKFPLHLRR